MHQNTNQNKNQQHVSVLLEQVLAYLKPQPGESYLDLTAGYGGHAIAVTELTGSLTQTVLIDRDINAIEELKKLFPDNTVNLRQQDYLSASRELIAQGQQFDLILGDLGVSSPHLNEGSRGFAINQSGPLDMRMDQSQELTAKTIINSFSESDLSDILYRYGEEPKSRQIARAIVKARPLDTTYELAEVVRKAWPGKSRVHPATRTFQALRIAVNDELSLLEKSLPLWLKLLKPGGRIAIISFHSLEDRLVKQALNEVSGNTYDASFKLLTKSPVMASNQEIVHNPRARSAKLRAAAKIKKKGNLHANSGKK
jgi:16S rRNA (cytosine1402-N4)-methyltransferase